MMECNDCLFDGWDVQKTTTHLERLPDKSEVEIKIAVDGKKIETKTASDNGPVDAIFKAIKNLIPHDAILELYQISAVTGGTDSQATATVRLRNTVGCDDKTITCSASDLNVLLASALAYINCLNKLKNA